MLIEFRVANFRSIREEQVLSMVASKADKTLPGNVIDREIPGLKGERFLKAAAIYGANASGKSNVLQAMEFMRRFVVDSAARMTQGDPIPVEPFKLDEESRTKPSTFEMTFAIEGVMYVFGFSATRERVVEEYLHAYPKGYRQEWYHREWDDDRGEYEWTVSRKSFKDDEALRGKTRENALLFSVGAQFLHAQLGALHNWFFAILETGVRRRFIRHEFSTTNEILKNRSKLSTLVEGMLAKADAGLVGANIETRKIERGQLVLDPESFRELERLRSQHGDPKEVSYDLVRLLHRSSGDKAVPLDFMSEESEGTRTLYGIAGYVSRALEADHVVMVDELDTSLHPHLVREILKLFLSEHTNPHGSQIVFTTHNPNLLDSSLIRRDQVWFTGKTNEGATILYPLTHYKPRNDEALAKAYLAGSYGGVPFIPDGLVP